MINEKSDLKFYEVALKEYQKILLSVNKTEINPLKYQLIDELSMIIYALNHSANRTMYDKMFREKFTQLIILNQISEISTSCRISR